MNLVYDCEIIQMIPPKGISRIDGFEYCDGWEDYEGMGISVICVADLDSELEESFNLNLRNDRLTEASGISQIECQRLLLANHISGFNSKKFDDLLCDAHGIAVTTDFDLLEQVRLSAYGSIEWFDCPRGFTYKLDALAQANGLGGKTGSGELAPKLWQQGRQEEVINYCMNDVRLTKQLILKFKAGELIDPNTGLILSPLN